MANTDRVTRFVFESAQVRGASARLRPAWRQVLALRDYPTVVRRFLGQAMVAAALLQTLFKTEAKLTLQIQGGGYLPLLLVQCDRAGTLRATARWQESESTPEASESLSALCLNANLSITLEPTGNTDRYQGVVELVGDDIAGALQHYFSRSEQLDSWFFLFCDARQALGFMLQRLPSDEDPDDWNRLTLIGQTIKPQELGTEQESVILRRLFPNDDIRLFKPQPLSFFCGCSRQRTAQMLVELGRDEIRDLLEELGYVEVKCGFCGRRFRFDPVDAEQLFNAPQPEVPTTPH